MDSRTSSLHEVVARTESWLVGSSQISRNFQTRLLRAREREIQKLNSFLFQVSARLVSTSRITQERFGVSDGSSGWKWDKGGVGMGGKDLGNWS